MKNPMQKFGLATLLTTIVCLPASALALSCGDLITSSVTLSADLLGCPDQGLFVRSVSGITIDLNGHKISGKPGSSNGIGIVDSSKVRIIGSGEISGFDAGVSVNYSNRITVQNLHLHNNGNNIYFLDTSDSLVTDNFLENGFNGLVIDGAYTSKNNEVTSNAIFTHASTGIYLRGAYETTVVGNTLRANTVAVGIANAERNIVEGNGIYSNVNGVVIDNSAPGGYGSHMNEVSGNKLYDNQIGVFVHGPAGGAYYLKYNEVTGNTLRGGVTGIEVNGRKAYRTQVTDNYLYSMSGSYIDDTGRATVLAGNVCSPGSC